MCKYSHARAMRYATGRAWCTGNGGQAARIPLLLAETAVLPAHEVSISAQACLPANRPSTVHTGCSGRAIVVESTVIAKSVTTPL